MSEDGEQYDETDLNAEEVEADVSDASSEASELDGDGEETDVTGPASAGEAVADTKHCTDCGASISRDAEICPECGIRQEYSPSGSASGEKESGVSAVLSFLLPGVGQLYNGQVSRGAVVFVGWMVWEFVAFVITTLTLGVFFLIWVPVELFVHVVAAYDAYNQAEKINAGDVVVD